MLHSQVHLLGVLSCVPLRLPKIFSALSLEYIKPHADSTAFARLNRDSLVASAQ
jgi:hypothetical protein